MKCEKSFAHQVRLQMERLGSLGQEVAVSDISDELGLVYGREKRPLYSTLRDFCKTGEIQKIRTGVYQYVGKTRPPEYQQVMWRILRKRKTVTAEALVETSGASRAYVTQWLRRLVKHGVLRKNPNGSHTLIHDPMDMPKDEEKAAYLRGLRAARKEAEAFVNRLTGMIEKGEADGKTL